MAGERRRRNAAPVADLVSAIVDPVLRKRAGISLDLIQSWEEVAGESVASNSRPEKIVWPRRAHEDDPFQPATLVVAAEGFAALALQHQTGELAARVNAFLGFPAIGRVKIVQKPVARDEPRKLPQPRKLTPAEDARLTSKLADIESDSLRAALERLGRGVMGSTQR